MNPRAFTTRIEMYHRLWLSRLLDLTPHFNGGIDLYDDKVGIELKCRYQKWNHGFAVDARQISKFEEENNEKELFWAFLFYDLKNPPRRIKNKDIGSHISDREVWFLPWDWIKPFPVSEPKTGPYVYIHRTDFPNSGYFHCLDSRFEAEREVVSTKMVKDRVNGREYRLYVPK